jgi:hypothetical protein
MLFFILRALLQKAYFKKPGFMTRFILHAPFLPLAFPHHEQPQAMDGALEGLADETGDLPLH